MVEYQSPDPRGDFSFDSNLTSNPEVPNSGNSIASFLLGYPASTNRNVFLIWPTYRLTELSLYAEDTWHARRWLTLNLGLRYDLFPPMNEKNNRISNWNMATGKIMLAGQNGTSDTAGMATDYKDFAPWVGFAVLLSPHTVLRGGYGISYLSWAMDMSIGGTLRNAPYISTYSPIPFSPFLVSNTIDQGFPTPVPQSTTEPTGTIAPDDPNAVPPSAQQYNLTLQRQIKGLVLTASYVGVLARHQMVEPNIDQPSPSTEPITSHLPYGSLFPGVTYIAYMENVGNGNYNGFQLTAEYRFKHGFGLESNYTWSHLMDNYCGDETGPGCFPWPQLMNDWHLEYATGSMNRTHVWSTMATYQLPFGRHLSGLAGAVGRGWQVNSILSLYTGNPFTISDSEGLANTGGGDRPNQIGNPHLAHPTIQEWFNTAAFAFQPFGTIGNVGRDTLTAPGFAQFDFSVFKNFPLWSESRVLQFRCEAWNLFNHPNFGFPDSGLGDPSFGQISDTAGHISREIDFALRLQF